METEVEIEIDEEGIKGNVCKKDKPSKQDIICGLLTAILFTLSIIVYLVVGFLTDIWHPTWVVFLAPIVIVSLVRAIWQKKASRFNYPLLVVMVYVLFSSIFGLWHPLWVLFITVPLYYSFLKLIKEMKK